jgi:hypothetical protein
LRRERERFLLLSADHGRQALIELLEPVTQPDTVVADRAE